MPQDRAKSAAIRMLFLMAVAITLLGATFSFYSIATGVQFRVLNSQIHGALFGAVIAFLGIRYILSVQKLKTELIRSDAKFSWRNFSKI